MAEFDLQFIVRDALGNGGSSRQERMESSSKGRRCYFEAEKEADVGPSALLIPLIQCKVALHIVHYVHL